MLCTRSAFDQSSQSLSSHARVKLYGPDNNHRMLSDLPISGMAEHDDYGSMCHDARERVLTVSRIYDKSAIAL